MFQLSELISQSRSPEVIRRFHAKSTPRQGAIRVHYGQTYDPERLISARLRHGVRTSSNETARELVNPPLITNFSRHLTEHRESIYHSNQKTPVGKVPDPTANLPDGFDPNNITFGVWSERGL